MFHNNSLTDTWRQESSPDMLSNQCGVPKRPWRPTPAPCQLVNRVISFLDSLLVMNILPTSYNVVLFNHDISWEPLHTQLAYGWLAQTHLSPSGLWTTVIKTMALALRPTPSVFSPSSIQFDLCNGSLQHQTLHSEKVWLACLLNLYCIHKGTKVLIQRE